MAGYQNFSKSNNAAAAEADGRYPASQAERKLGLPAGFCKAHCRFATGGEWHHTSSWYNRVDYYDTQIIQEWMKHQPDTASEDAEDLGIPSEKFADVLAQFKTSKTAKSEVRHEGCRVRWLEWSGSRNHPKCTRREEHGATVTDRGGSMLDITLATGQTFRKSRTTRGFEVKASDGTKLVSNFGWDK